ncbi:unnamed protein product [Rotaria sp. Silwood2]|nr:unnamed protein product [Rotaria sp. Silwood2]
MPGETETTIISISAESVSTIGYVPETSAASETIATSTAKITIPAATSSESSEETVSLSSTSTSKNLVFVRMLQIEIHTTKDKP